MAKIDPTKLLPPAKSSAIVPYRKPTIVGSTKTAKISSAIQPISLASKSSAIVKKKNDETIQEVVVKLIGIQGVLTEDLRLSQSRQRTANIQEEKKEAEKKEEKLEEPKAKGFKFPKLPELPTIGFFERIKRFLFFTALGWLLPKIIEFLPKLEGIVKTIGTVYGFAENLFGKLLDGFSSLVKFGGDLTKKTLGFIAQTGLKPGEKFDDKFNALETTFNRFVDASIIAGLLSADLGLAAFDEYKKLKGKNKPGAEPRRGGKPPVPRGRVQVTEGRGGQPGLGGGARVTESKPQSWWSKLTGKIKGSFADFRKSVFSKIVEPFKNLIKPFSRLKGPLSRFGGSVIPGLGAVVGAIDAKDRFSRGDNLGGTLASISATLDALTVGSAATGIGLPVAALFGTISMAIDVIVLIRDLLQIAGVPDKLLGFSKGGRVIRRYQGGGTTPTRGGKPVAAAPRRSIKIEKKKKPFKLPPTQTKPGKDVGGEEKIKILYPEPKKPLTLEQWMAKGDMAGTYPMYLDNFNQSEEDKKPDAFTALTSVAKTVKPIDVVGQLMGAGVDLALGQAPDKKIFNSFFDNIGYLADTWMNQRMNRNISLISREISSFADGGKVPPSRELRDVNNNESFGDVLTKLLGPMINQRINQSLQYIKKEIQKKPEKEEGRPGSGAELGMEGGSLQVTSDSPDFWLLVAASLFENGIPTDGYQGAADVAQAIYNRVSLPGWPKSIREVILQRGQFTPVRRYGGYNEWSKINSRESVIAFAKKYKGYSGNIVDQVAAALLNSSKQEKARSFVGPRDNFRTVGYEQQKNHLDNSTEVSRYGHVFGFEPGGLNIAAFKRRQLMPAAINQQVVRGNVTSISLGQGVSTTVIDEVDVVGNKHPTVGRSGNSGEYLTRGGSHHGIDIGTSRQKGWYVGFRIPGKVVFTGPLGGYGNTVKISSNGKIFLFAHLRTINVRVNQPYNGETIGEIGNTGKSSGEHLHFEVRINGRHQNPEPYLRYLAIGRKLSGTAGATQGQQGTRPQGSPPGRTGSELASQMMDGRIIRSVKVGGDTYTERENGIYTRNSVFITKEEFNRKVEPQPAQGNWLDRLNPFRQQPQTQSSSNIQGVIEYRGQLYFRRGNDYYEMVRNGVPTKIASTPGESRQIYDMARSLPGARVLQDSGNDRKTYDRIRRHFIKKQQGGLISPSKPTRTIPNSFASYENYGQGPIVAMQPIIIERVVPINSSGSGVIAFPQFL